MDNQPGPTACTVGLCSMLCGSLDRMWVWRRNDTCICTAGSLYCSPEIITTLLITYTSIQNKKFKNLKCPFICLPSVTHFCWIYNSTLGFFPPFLSVEYNETAFFRVLRLSKSGSVLKGIGRGTDKSATPVQLPQFSACHSSRDKCRSKTPHWVWPAKNF